MDDPMDLKDAKKHTPRRRDIKTLVVFSPNPSVTPLARSHSPTLHYTPQARSHSTSFHEDIRGPRYFRSSLQSAGNTALTERGLLPPSVSAPPAAAQFVDKTASSLNLPNDTRTALHNFNHSSFSERMVLMFGSILASHEQTRQMHELMTSQGRSLVEMENFAHANFVLDEATERYITQNLAKVGLPAYLTDALVT
ncbi:hypothetical protein K439DRAFT_1615864 [Ramaria rubella]|nr:hypothetical protein K439DRAFT_1615864 [Ramaria rubella]